MKTPMVSPPAPRRTQPGITLRDKAFHVRVLGEISPEFGYGEATVQKKASGSHNLKRGHGDAVACNGRTCRQFMALNVPCPAYKCERAAYRFL